MSHRFLRRRPNEKSEKSEKIEPEWAPPVEPKAPVVIPEEEQDNPNMSNMISRHFSRSKSAKERPAPPKGHPLASMEYEGSRHMVPERLPSAKRDRAVGLRVIDLNNDTVENIRSLSKSLKRLDLSDLHLAKLNEELMAELTSLEKLDVSNNELTEDSFPASCKYWDKLLELTAHNNQLAHYPKSLRRLRNLTRLKFGNNKLNSIEGIEKLKKLTVLVLEGNRLETIPREFYAALKRLELFHCGHNKLASIHPDIRHLRFLKDLDISNNKLNVLPPEVLLLPRIEVINASNNNISRMPSINVKGRVTRKLAAVDLSGNSLMKFPEHLMYLTNKLDLSRNRIKVIPAHTFKKMDWATTQEVILQENPLTTPPPDICECGLRAIMQYFQEEKVHMKVYQGLKVMVLGDSEQGKTSLIQTIVDQQSRLCTERTIGTDFYDFVIDIPAEPTVNVYVPPADEDDVEADDTVPPLPPQDMPLNLSLYDFSGNKRYLFPHYFFLHQPSLCLIVFDLSKYDESKFASRIGSWIDYIIARSNKLVLLPVGTHADKLKAKQVEERCADVSERIKNHLASRRENIEREIKKIEDRPHISPSLSEQLKLFISLLKLESHVYERVLPVSASTMSGLDRLLKGIEEMATQKEVFPNVLRTIPSLWGEVENYVEDRGYAMKVPVLPWGEFFEQVTRKFGMKHLMTSITQYLHDIGKVVWFADHPTLKEFVFIRPSWIVECLNPIFRHDIKDLDYTVEECFKQCGVGVTKFEGMKQELSDDGIVDRDYLKCCLSHMIPHDVNRPLFEVCQIFLNQFEIGYPQQRFGGKQPPVDNPKLDVPSSPITGRRADGGKPRELSSPGPQRKSSEGASPALSRRMMDTSSPSSNRRADRADSASTVRSSRQESRPESGRPGSSASKSGKSQDKEANGDKDGKQTAEPVKFNKLLIPWLRVLDDPPPRFKEEYGKLDGYPFLAAIFSFPYYIPPGFFETLTVRAAKSEYFLTMQYHWRKGFYAKHVEKPLRLYLERVEHEEGGTCIRIETKHNRPTGEVDKETEVLWSVMLPFLKDAEDLIAKYPGAHIERYMECPECRSLSFLGEWLTPKELQGLQTRLCEACKKDINTAYLVQPKDKRRVEDFLLQKLAKEAEARKQQDTIKEEDEDDIGNNRADRRMSTIAPLENDHAPLLNPPAPHHTQQPTHQTQTHREEKKPKRKASVAKKVPVAHH